MPQSHGPLIKRIQADEKVYARFLLARRMRYPNARTNSEALNAMMDDLAVPHPPYAQGRERAGAFV